MAEPDDVIERAAALRDRAEALVPILAERAEACEKARQVLPETIADLKAAGLHRLCQPRRFGGHELSLNLAVDIITVLARGCASTAWVAAIYCDHQILVGRFADDASDDVWAENPDHLVSAGFIPSGAAERVDGGWRVTGRWAFSSGCDHADWLLVGSPLPLADGKIEPSLCLVPRSEVEIDDDWHVMGLSGTGSKTLVVNGAEVPEYRTLPLWKAGAGAAGGRSDVPPLYRIGHFPAVPFLFLATSLGIAESVLDTTIESMSQRVSSRGDKIAELQSIQMRIAESAAEIDIARLLTMRDCTAAMDAAREGRTFTLHERARGRRDQAYAGTLCRRAVERLFTATGAHGLYLGNVMQRKFRDVCATNGHISGNWDLAATTYGRVMLGLDPNSMFV